MNILLVLIPVTLVVIAIAVTLFFWAVNNQQFDDLDSPGVLPLMDDPPPLHDADATEDASSDASRVSAPETSADPQPDAAPHRGARKKR